MTASGSTRATASGARSRFAHPVPIFLLSSRACRCAVLVAAVLATAGAPASAAAAQIRTEVGAIVQSWTYQTYLEEVGVDQTVIPIRAEADFAPWQFDLSLDYAKSGSSDDAGTDDLSGFSRFGIGASRFAWENRFRFEVGADWILEQGPYELDEARALSRLAEPVLSLPAGYLGTGHRFHAAAQGIVFEQRGLVGVAGAHIESSGAYDLRDDGLDASGGMAAGLAFGLDQATSLALFHHAVWWRSGRSEDVGGSPAFDLGSEFGVGSDARIALAAGDFSVGLEVLFVSAGSVDPDLLLESAFVRGGNRFRWQLGWAVQEIWSWRVGLGGTHHRGFSSALGRSDWITPSAGIGWSVGAGDVSFDLEYSAGKVREGRDISGFGLVASWSQEWSR